jgi:hypothetical protein
MTNLAVVILTDPQEKERLYRIVTRYTTANIHSNGTIPDRIAVSPLARRGRMQVNEGKQP